MATLDFKFDSENVKRALKLFATAIGLLFLTGTISYIIIAKTSIQNAFMLTLETLALMDIPEMGLAGKFLRIFLMLFGVIMIWWITWSTFDMAIQGHLENYFKRVKKMEMAKKLTNHYIICGAGRVGSHVAELLQKENKQYIIIERDEFLVHDLEKKGFHVIEGDALDEQTLKNCGIGNAKAVIAVLPETEKNILIILTARDLNPKIKIYARSNKKELNKKLKHAGADYIVNPELTGAEEIVHQINGEK